MKKYAMLTSETATEGHPDKLCDQICDAIVDRFLQQDRYARIRCECAVSNAIVFIAARFSCSEAADLAQIARDVIEDVGYKEPDFNAKNCSILTIPQELPCEDDSRFDEQALTEKEADRIAVKNQVTVFGCACDHTPALMPLPIWLCNRIARQLDMVRKEGRLSYLRPDGKVHVGIDFFQNNATRVHSISLMASQSNLKKPGRQTVYDDIRETVIDPVFASEDIKIDNGTRIFINPDGPYLGGPSEHPGLTGRKNAADTYGEYCRRSGSALSGKDPLRIDRVGVYMARYAAKNIVAAGLACCCEVACSYSIGMAEPVSLQVETFGTGVVPDEELVEQIKRHFDFRVATILKVFHLRDLPRTHPDGFYRKLATYGHLGRTDLDLPWEKTDKSDLLK